MKYRVAILTEQIHIPIRGDMSFSALKHSLLSNTALKHVNIFSLACLTLLAHVSNFLVFTFSCQKFFSLCDFPAVNFQ